MIIMNKIYKISAFGLALLFTATASCAFEDIAGSELGEGDDGDGDDWPQFHLGPDHIGASPSTAPRTNQTAWVSEEIGAKAGSSLSIAEGKIFVNCNDFLVCLDEFTGDAIWNVSCEPNPYGSWSSPAYCDGKVFFSNYETLCLNAKDGCMLWSFEPPSGLGAVNGGPVIAEGKVIVSDWDGRHYYCLDEETGLEIWNFTVEGYAQSTPAISDGRAIFGSWEWNSDCCGHIHCLNLTDGVELWNRSTENSPCGSASILGDVAYVTTFSFYGLGDVFAISMQNGTIMWNETIQRTDSTPISNRGKVYVCSGVSGFSDLQTYCFDASTGDLIWMTKPEEEIGDWMCSAAYADDLIFVGKGGFDDYAGICALNASDGKVVWQHPHGGSSPAIADGMVFTVDDEKVYAFGEC